MNRVEKTDSKCVVCKGSIVEGFEKRQTPGNGIMGPGGRTHEYEVFVGYHCENCGIAYAVLPKEE